MREESDLILQRKDSNEKQDRAQSFLAKLGIKNKNESQTEGKFPMRFSNTRLFRSFHIAQIMPCRHSCHSFLELLPRRNGLQEVKRSINETGIAILKLANSKSLSRNLQLKGQWINEWALDSAAERHKGQ